jgi:hypothetical protein
LRPQQATKLVSWLCSNRKSRDEQLSISEAHWSNTKSDGMWDKPLPEIEKRYTQEEFLAHLNAVHPGWALCKGCEELIWDSKYERGKGWCDLCVILCYDCMDEEKYGPEEPLIWPSVSTKTEVSNPGPDDDPGPPPHYDWLTPKLYTGRSEEPSTMAKIVSGIRMVHDMFLFAVDHVRRMFR